MTSADGLLPPLLDGQPPRDPAATTPLTAAPGDAREWLSLHLVPEVGAITFGRLVAHFGRPAAVLQASESQLRQVPGVGPTRAKAIARAAGGAVATADDELARSAAMGVAVVCANSGDYPRLLAQIDDPPPVLYVWGSLAVTDNLAVAVVGSREATAYGLTHARRLAHDMAAAGLTVVSGLARGVDAAAHQGALAAPAGRTLAVLGSGLAHVYPPDNRPLAEAIATTAPARGAVLSEFPLTTKPAVGHFPQRNRIIAGLSLAVLVVEAPLRSGSLITARLALDSNREVLAVPGLIDQPSSAGCHSLIKQGARLVEGLSDILEALGEPGRLLAAARPTTAPSATAPSATAPPVVPVAQSPAAPRGEARATRPPAPREPDRQGPLATAPAPTPGSLSGAHAAIVAALADGPLGVDELVAATGLGAGAITAALIKLELLGHIRTQAGGRFARCV